LTIVSYSVVRQGDKDCVKESVEKEKPPESKKFIIAFFLADKWRVNYDETLSPYSLITTIKG